MHFTGLHRIRKKEQNKVEIICHFLWCHSSPLLFSIKALQLFPRQEVLDKYFLSKSPITSLGITELNTNMAWNDTCFIRHVRYQVRLSKSNILLEIHATKIFWQMLSCKTINGNYSSCGIPYTFLQCPISLQKRPSLWGPDYQHSIRLCII